MVPPEATGANASADAFDLLYVDGVDLRDLPLVERKAKLRKLIPRKVSSVLYLEHINCKGVELFEQCCELDLEGVVAKPKQSPYRRLDGKLCTAGLNNFRALLGFLF